MKITSYSIFILFFTLFHLNGSMLFGQNAVISEKLQELKTYPYSDPNPVANIGRIYPYFRFDGYSHSGQPQKWKMVTLENPYIKVFITPEIGGKIWGAMDKASGKMFIYYNHVVKFRNIAMRGPWTSGGIEINFGIIGHAPTGSSPVDYILQENSDSSVSCVIGSMDLPSRTSWRVEIRLPKDKAFFETNVLWHNQTSLNQPYYHWMNGAARASNDLQFFFPGNSYIGHDGSSHAWTKDDDERDLSFYVNNNFGPYKSYHVLGQYTGFFGGYYFQDQFGFGNWSAYADKPGKKLWIWGLSRQGMIWENLLTDSDGQYIEMQSGRLFNQAGSNSSETPFKHRKFAPYSTDIWSEIWFPVKETKGMRAVSPFGILNIEPTANQLKIYFCPLQKIDDSLTVEVGGKTFYARHLILEPLEVFIDSVNLKLSDKFHVNLGQNKLNYSPSDQEKNSLNRPLKSPADFNWDTVQGLALKAREENRQRNYKAALDGYLNCLKKDPNYIEALTGLAELYYRRMDYDTALTYIKRALAVDTYNGASNFLYGLINRQSNSRTDAKDGFSLAAQSMEFRSAAFTQLAEIYAEEGFWDRAAEYAQRAIDFNKYNLNAYQVLVISHRKQNRMLESQKAVDVLLKTDPLNHFAGFEQHLLLKNSKSLQKFQQLIRGEFPSETFLELAITYYNLGLIEESLYVLEKAPVHPVLFYWRAFLYDLMGEREKSRGLLIKAETQSVYLVFPFRYETADIMKWAISQSSHWKGKYYLALIYWNKGKPEKAQELLFSCRNEPDYSPFYLTRGKFFEPSDVSQSLKDYRRAIEFDKADWRAWMMLSELYHKIGDQQNSFIAVETIYKQKPNDYRLAIPYAKALYQSEKYQECILILDKTKVLPFEGASGARKLFHDAHIMSAIQNIEQDELQKALTHLDKARLWPENLGAGRPYDVDERLEDYLEMLLRIRLNHDDKAEKSLMKIIFQTEVSQAETGPNLLISALALDHLGKRQEALSLLDKWAKVSTDSELAFWAIARFNGNSEDENRFYQKIKDRTDIKIYLKAVSLTIRI